MQNFLLGCALGAAIVASVGVPLLAPWPLRVRYLVNAQTIDPLLGLGPLPRLGMRAVELVAVDHLGTDVRLTVDDAGSTQASRTVTFAGTCPPALVAELDEWLALRTPLLLIVDENDWVHLCGPNGTVTNLHRVESRSWSWRS